MRVIWVCRRKLETVLRKVFGGPAAMEPVCTQSNEAVEVGLWLAGSS